MFFIIKFIECMFYNVNNQMPLVIERRTSLKSPVTFSQGVVSTQSVPRLDASTRFESRLSVPSLCQACQYLVCVKVVITQPVSRLSVPSLVSRLSVPSLCQGCQYLVCVKVVST